MHCIQQAKILAENCELPLWAEFGAGDSADAYKDCTVEQLCKLASGYGLAVPSANTPWFELVKLFVSLDAGLAAKHIAAGASEAAAAEKVKDDKISLKSMVWELQVVAVSAKLAQLATTRGAECPDLTHAVALSTTELVQLAHKASPLMAGDGSSLNMYLVMQLKKLQQRCQHRGESTIRYDSVYRLYVLGDSDGKDTLGCWPEASQRIPSLSPQDKSHHCPLEIDMIKKLTVLSMYENNNLRHFFTFKGVNPSPEESEAQDLAMHQVAQGMKNPCDLCSRKMAVGAGTGQCWRVALLYFSHCIPKTERMSLCLSKRSLHNSRSLVGWVHLPLLVSMLLTTAPSTDFFTCTHTVC